MLENVRDPMLLSEQSRYRLPCTSSHCTVLDVLLVLPHSAEADPRLQMQTPKVLVTLETLRINFRPLPSAIRNFNCLILSLLSSNR